MGNGEKLDEYMKLTEELGLRDDVVFTGEVSRMEVAEVMNRCDLGVIPYDENPLWMSAYGTKIFENCASGLPTVVSALSGSDLEKLVNSREIGLVAAPLKVEEFTDRIEQLASNTALRVRMRDNALRLVEESFSRKRLADTLLKLCE